MQSCFGYPVGVPAPHDVERAKSPAGRSGPRKFLNDLLESAVSLGGGSSRVDLGLPGWCLDHRCDLDLRANPTRNQEGATGMEGTDMGESGDMKETGDMDSGDMKTSDMGGGDMKETGDMDSGGMKETGDMKTSDMETGDMDRNH
jgi:hypothetical protein